MAASFLNEPDALTYHTATAATKPSLVFVATISGAFQSYSNRCSTIRRCENLDLMLFRISAEVVPVTLEQVEIGRIASHRQVSDYHLSVRLCPGRSHVRTAKS